MGLELTKRYKKWLFLIPLFLFIIDYILVELGICKTFDLLVYQWLHKFDGNLTTQFFTAVTYLGDIIGAGLIIIGLFIFNRKMSFDCLKLTIIIQVVNLILKVLIKRARPSVEHLITVSNYSFPSGHAMTITGLYGLIIFYLWQYQFKYRRSITLLCVIVIVLVDLSRVYLGVHYFSDVFGGTMLSISLIMMLKLR